MAFANYRRFRNCTESADLGGRVVDFTTGEDFHLAPK